MDSDKMAPNHLGLRYNSLPEHQNGPNHLGLRALQWLRKWKTGAAGCDGELNAWSNVMCY